MTVLMEKTSRFVLRWMEFLTRPHFICCFLIAWFLTNGWSYVGLIVGSILHLPLLKGICGGYVALLWMPFTPEKLITLTITIFLLKKLYPEDEEGLRILLNMKKSRETRD